MRHCRRCTRDPADPLRGAHLTITGCIGQCAYEPLVTVHRADAPPVMYGHVTADKVPELVEKHLVQGQVIQEWVVETS